MHKKMPAYAKDDVRYWRFKVYFPKFSTAGGTLNTAKHYAIRLSWQGKRINWTLGTGNREVAAQKAKDVYMSLLREGYEETLKAYRPSTSADTPVTLGHFLERLEHTNEFTPKTFKQYRTALRRIVADVLGIEHTKSRFSRYSDHEAWTGRIDSTPLALLTEEKMQEWKVGALKRGLSPNTVNTTLGGAKALFSPDRVKFLGFSVTSPFAGVKMAKRPSPRYHSKINLEDLTRKALSELPPEPLKFFLLAGLAGLRRGEIDGLEWSSFNWDKAIITIGKTRWFQPKSENSVRSVELDNEVSALFRGFHAKAEGSFVVESKRNPRQNAPAGWYRCGETIKELSAWLKEKGLKTKPLHTLRKEFGSVVCDRHGIYAASLSLGHANIGITARYYLDKKGRATVGLGHLLASDKVIQIPPDPTPMAPVTAERQH
jgi:integrase